MLLYKYGVCFFTFEFKFDVILTVHRR